MLRLGYSPSNGRLARGKTAVDGQTDARDGRGLLAGEESHSMSHVLRVDDAVERVPLRDVMEDLRVALLSGGPGSGPDGARGDCVGSNAEAAVLHGDGPCEVDEAGLCGAVGWVPVDGQPVDGDDVDDGAARAFEVSREGVEAEERSIEIEGRLALPGLRRGLVEAVGC